MATFAANLRRIRRQRGLTCEELAEKVQVSVQSVALWEAGRIVPKINRIYVLSRVLDVKMADLLESLSTENKKTFTN